MRLESDNIMINASGSTGKNHKKHAVEEAPRKSSYVLLVLHSSAAEYGAVCSLIASAVL